MNVYHVQLTEEEKQTLEQMYHFGPSRRLRQRAHMILLSSSGYCQKEITKIVFTSYPTARYYIHAYSEDGFLALYDEPKSGRPAKLSSAQIEQIDRWLAESPRKVGYNQSNWTVRLMQYQIQKQWGIQLSNERVRQLFHQCGYSLVRPRHDSQNVSEAEKKRPKMTWRLTNNERKMPRFVCFSATKSA